MLDRVSRRQLVALLLLAAVAAACGGSQNAPSSSATAAAQSAGSSTTSTASTTRRTPSRRYGHASSHATKASNVRLPATYVIRRGGVLSPPLVAAPAAVTIALTVVSSDGRAHRVALRSPNAPMLVVPAAGRASSLLAGLRAGSYGIYVDGVRRGALVIGVAPGP